MTRNLKALGLALLAVFALGAIGAQGASAADEHEFKADFSKSIITGTGTTTHEFTVGAVGTVKCTNTKFEGTVNAGAGKEVDQITIKPTYTGCEFGGQVATVNFNHCAYVFDSDTTLGNTTEGKHAAVVIECAANNKIQVHTVNCTVTIGPQTVGDAVRYQKDPASETATETIATAHNVVVGKERTTESQAANGCLLFPTGAVGKYIGTATNECRQDESDPAGGFNPTTPTGTQDAAKIKCEVTNI